MFFLCKSKNTLRTKKLIETKKSGAASSNSIPNLDWIGYDIRKLSSFKKILYSNFHGVGEKRQSREKSGVIITLDFFLFCLIFPFNVKLTVSPMHFVMIQVEKIVILEQLESSSFPYVGINGNHLTTFVSSKLNNWLSFWPIDLILVSKCLE